MYTLTVFLILALVVGIALAVVVPMLRKQMRVVPGPGEQHPGWRRDLGPTVRRDDALPPRIDPDRPKQP